jgi:hypothetical protein
MKGLIIGIVTLVILLACSVGTGFMAMILANGFMGNTDPMAFAYLTCNGLSVLALSVIGALLANFLMKTQNFHIALAGAISVGLAIFVFPILMFFAFFIAVTFFS